MDEIWGRVTTTSLPLSRVMLRGAAPRAAIARVRAANTFGPFIERSASSHTHSRVNWSIAVSIRNARPSVSLSLTKSADQQSFGLLAWV